MNLHILKFCIICICYRIKCKRCVNGIQVKPPPIDSDCTDDLVFWHHSQEKRWLIDPVLKHCWDIGISFVFFQNSQKCVPQVMYMFVWMCVHNTSWIQHAFDNPNCYLFICLIKFSWSTIMCASLLQPDRIIFKKML